MLYWWAMILVWPFFTIFFPTKVYGKKNLIKGKCIWACNHQSNNDIFVLATKLFARVYILGKKELFKNKFVGGFLKKLGGIPVSRGEADITAVKDCLRVLKEKNKPLVIFPSGTRESSPDEVENLKSGVAMFATKTDSKIVPMVFERKPRIFRPNRLIIGEPIDVEKFKQKAQGKELYALVCDELSRQMEILLLKHPYKSKKKKSKVEAK